MTVVAASVQADSFLTLHYRLSGPAGDVINTFGGTAATLTLGAGVLAPAVEACLLGLPLGAQRTFELPPGAAFGARNPAMLQWVAVAALRAVADAPASFQVGDVVQFPTPDGQARFAGVVRRLREDGAAVLFDFNHPLAGQAVVFEVQLIGIL